MRIVYVYGMSIYILYILYIYIIYIYYYKLYFIYYILNIKYYIYIYPPTPAVAGECVREASFVKQFEKTCWV